jgi:hypothetical protein
VLQLFHTYANTVRRTRSRFSVSSLYHFSYVTSKQPPKTKLRRPNKVTIVEVSDDTGEEDTDDKSVPKSASGQKRKRDIQGAHDRADNSKETKDFFSYYVSGDH